MSVLFDQTPFLTSNGTSITPVRLADNVSIPNGGTIENATVYVSGGNGQIDGDFRSFSGTIGWAIYTDNSGKPGTLLASGSDTIPTVTDTNLNSSAGNNIFKIDFDLGSGITLPPGSYWFALQEGQWGSPGDGSLVFWRQGTSADTNGIFADSTDDDPIVWLPYDFAVNMAFTLFGNAGPGFSTPAALSANENQKTVTTIAATDLENDPLTFTITGGNDRLLFDLTSGNLTFKSAPNFEAPTDTGADGNYEIEITVSDGQGHNVARLFTVTVADVNEVPVITSNGGDANAAVDVAENSTAVTTVIASDPENTALQFSISGGADAGLFDIDPDTGALTFKAAPDFENPADAGSNNVYNVVVKASDGTLFDTQSIAITVTNRDEAPIISSNGGGANATVDVAENGKAVTKVIASDPQSLAITYSLSGDDRDLFKIDADTGVLTFKAAPDFEAPGDENGDNVYDVIVTASNGALSDSQSIAVTVTDVNEAPVITSDGGQATAAVSLRENRTQVTTVTAEDPDAKTLLTYSLSGGADRDLFDIDPDTGVLTFKAAPDFENPTDANGDNTYVVKVTVDDGSGETDSQTLSITVTNGNDRPVITSDGGKLKASVDVAENSTAVTKVQASDQDGSSITYAISGGDDKALFSIDATTGKVTFKSAPDFEEPQDKNHDNAYQITVRVTDSDGAIDVQYLTINVTDVDGVTITGTEGADKVSANKTVAGQPAPTGEEDHILGLGGNDRLSGLGGDDILEGGAGKDILKGGAGHDHFVYLDVADSSGTGIDRIRDFTQGEDVIDLSAIDGGFHFLGEAGFDGTAGALRQRTAGADVFLEGDTDGNGVADLVILLKGSAGLVLTDGDLVL